MHISLQTICGRDQGPRTMGQATCFLWCPTASSPALGSIWIKGEMITGTYTFQGTSCSSMCSGSKIFIVNPTQMKSVAGAPTWDSPGSWRMSGLTVAGTPRCPSSLGGSAGPSGRRTPACGTGALLPCWSDCGNPSNTWKTQDTVRDWPQLRWPAAAVAYGSEWSEGDCCDSSPTTYWLYDSRQVTPSVWLSVSLRTCKAKSLTCKTGKTTEDRAQTSRFTPRMWGDWFMEAKCMWHSLAQSI